MHMFKPLRWMRFVYLSVLLLLLSGVQLMAQTPAVQHLPGNLAGKGVIFYQLPDLQAGDVLYVYAAGVTQNLDPFVALADEELSGEELGISYRADVAQAIAAGDDPLSVIPEVADQFFLAWDDDSGQGYDARLKFQIPADGNYRLLVLSSPAQETFGDFELQIGLNSPAVWEGEGVSTGAEIATLDPTNSVRSRIVETRSGSLGSESASQIFTLEEIKPGDTLYVFAEGTSGDLRPVLHLLDYGGKPIATDNFGMQNRQASLFYDFDQVVENYRVRVEAAAPQGAMTSGDYRLLIGINEPLVLKGNAEETPAQPRTLLVSPIPVQVGMVMEQVTSIDQKSENFGVVVDMRMRWTDPRMAFSPDECNCNFQTFTLSRFEKFLADRDINQWPGFTLFNQQGRRDSQNQLIAVWPDGEALYVERFSATLQAPDFDFTKFPFDVQQFYIRVRAVFPEQFFVYQPMPNTNAFGSQLGEEEWVITGLTTEVDSSDGNSRFSFGFKGFRHLNFYIFRIFLPIIIIIIVSWFTFFLKDYGKRVDVASGNLLLFIAFNFTISSELPRLGYLTLLDIILISTFVVTALVIAFNVVLKRLEVEEKTSFVQRLDAYMIWFYPVLYFVAFVVVTAFFGNR